MPGQPAASEASILLTIPIPIIVFEVGCIFVWDLLFYMVSSGKSVARHVPVLLGEVVRFMIGESPIAGRGVYVDATFGSGGHSKSLLGQLTTLRVVQTVCMLCI